MTKKGQPENKKSRRDTAMKMILAGKSLDETAAAVGVSARTISRWCDEGDWRNLSKAEQIVHLVPVVTPDSHRRNRKKIDELEIVESAIISLDVLLSNDSIDLRGVGGVAGALVKLLEYRRKVAPPTAAELAAQVIELGISPAEFVQELKGAWHRQQA